MPRKYDDLAKNSESAGDDNKAMLHRKRKELVENEVCVFKIEILKLNLIYLFIQKKKD